MRLLWVEIRRLFARRFFWMGALVLLVGLATVLVVTAVDRQRPTSEDRSRARAAAAAEAPRVEADRQHCLDDQRATPAPAEGTALDCNRTYPAPSEDQFLYDNPFRFAEEMPGRTHLFTVVLLLFGFLAGATFVGAEWHHGTLAGLLLWEPRRPRVFGAKLGALLVGVGLLSVLGYAASAAGHYAVAYFRGIVGTLSVDLQNELVLTAARGLGLTLVGTAIGFAVALTLRRTAAAMGVAIAYLGVIEIGARAFSGQSPRWLLGTYVTAWMENGTSVSVFSCTRGEGCQADRIDIEMWHGGLYLGVLTLIILAVAAVVFRRREVA